jgi:ribosomal-protein-alanine N-acetyltransferase
MRSTWFAVGERVALAKPSRRDGEEYLALVRSSWAFLRPWMVTPPPGWEPDDPRFFEFLLRANEGDRSLKCFVRRREDDALIGVVNYNEIVRGPFQNAYLGYWIGAAYARQGYMTEALALALDHAFGPMGLHRVEANVIPGNRASNALARRLGFRREGLSPRYVKIAGRWQDHVRWALRADEWKGIPVNEARSGRRRAARRASSPRRSRRPSAGARA